MSTPSDWSPATLLVQGGLDRTPFGETAEALFLTSGFVYDSAEQAEATFKERDRPLPVHALRQPHRRHAGTAGWRSIEGAEACCATATGMAAVHAALFAAREGRRPRRGLARPVRRLPLDRLHAAAALRHRDRIRRWHRPRPVARGAGPARRGGAAGDAVQPDAGDRRPACGGRACPRRRRARGGGQRVRDPAAAEAPDASAPMSSSIPAPSTSTARAACWAAPCWAERSGSTRCCCRSCATPARHAVAVQRLAAAEGAGDAGAPGRGLLPLAPRRSPTSWPGGPRSRACGTRPGPTIRSTGWRRRRPAAAARW